MSDGASRGLAGSLLLLLGAVLLILAAFTPWWTLSLSAPSLGSGSLSENFYPGNKVSVEEQNGSQSVSVSVAYSMVGLGDMASMYEGVEGLLLISALFLGVAGVLGVLTSRHVFARPRRGLVLTLGAVFFLVTILVVLLVASDQPSLFDSANPSGMCTGLGSSNSPCTSFWGSLSASGDTATWGPGTGWYLALVAGSVALIGTVLGRKVGMDSSDLSDLGFGSLQGQLPGSTKDQGAYGGVADPRAPVIDAYSGSVPGSAPLVVPPGASPSPALAAPPEGTASDLAVAGDVDRISQLWAAVRAGKLTGEDFSSGKRAVLATPLPGLPPVTLGERASELAQLEQLREARAVNDGEYLAIRRRILMRTRP